jgi:hypothetical protein
VAINLGQQLGIQQRAVFVTVAVVDTETTAQRIQIGGGTAKLRARQSHGIHHRIAQRRMTQQCQFSVQEF